MQTLSVNGADPDLVQHITQRLSTCSAVSHTQSRRPSSRRPSSMDADLSADIGIPIYSSITDSEDSEEEVPIFLSGQSRREAARPTRLSQVSFSWVPTMMSITSKIAAWGSHPPPWGSDGSGSTEDHSSTKSSSTPRESIASGCHALDFIIRPPYCFPSSGGPLDDERGQSAGQAMSSYSRMRLMIFFMLEDPFGSRNATAVSAIFIFAILAGIALTFLEYIPRCTDDESDCRLSALEWTICVFYTAEVLLRFWCCPRTCGFFTYLPNVVDACNSIECWLSMATRSNALSDWPVLKLMRHFEAGLRLLKLCRYSSSWQLLCATLMDSAPALLLPIAAYVILVALGAGLLLVAEKSVATPEAASAGTPAVSGLYDAVLFCMLCLVSTQTGPFNGLDVQSSVGSVIVGCLMVCGHIIFAMPITIIGTCFCRTWFQRDRVLFTKVVRRRLNWQGAEARRTLRQLFDRFTSDDSDALGLDEFYCFVAAIIPSPSANQVLALFSTFDQDQDGYIGFQELYATFYPEADQDLCGVLTADAPGNNDNAWQSQATVESDAASGSHGASDDHFGAICKSLQTFEGRLLEMLEQCLRLVERDQQVLATPPWVSPRASASCVPRREQQTLTAPWVAFSASSSLRARPSGSSSALAKLSGSSCFSPRLSGVSSLTARASGSSAFTSSSLWSLLPSPSSVGSIHSCRVSQSQSGSRGHMRSSVNTDGSSSFCSNVLGLHLDNSAPQRQVSPQTSALQGHSAPAAECPHSSQSPHGTCNSAADPRMLLQLPHGTREPVRSEARSNSAPEMRRACSPCSHSPSSSKQASGAASRENSPSRRTSQGSASTSKPTLKRQLTLTRIRNLGSLDEVDDLTPALQPHLSGQWRMLTVKNAAEGSVNSTPKGSPKPSPRSLSKNSREMVSDELSGQTLSRAALPVPSASPPTSPSSSGTMVSLPISVPIPKNMRHGWKKRFQEKVIAAKSQVSDHARRWSTRPDSATGQSSGSSCAGAVANGLV